MPIRRSQVENVYAPATSYSTTFSATENPLTEGGVWVRPATSVWNTSVRSESGAAFGDPASNNFNDSVIMLAGSQWLPHQSVSAVAKINATGGPEELEFHLRAAYNSTQIFSYEIDFVPSGLVIAKWNGNQGSFTNLTFTNGTSGSYVGGAIANGDVMTAEIVTNSPTSITIYVKQNGTLIGQADDTSSPYLSGTVGIGFDVGGTGTYTARGWDSFSVVTS